VLKPVLTRYATGMVSDWVERRDEKPRRLR